MLVTFINYQYQYHVRYDFRYKNVSADTPEYIELMCLLKFLGGLFAIFRKTKYPSFNQYKGFPIENNLSSSPATQRGMCVRRNSITVLISRGDNGRSGANQMQVLSGGFIASIRPNSWDCGCQRH